MLAPTVFGKFKVLLDGSLKKITDNGEIKDEKDFKYHGFKVLTYALFLS